MKKRDNLVVVVIAVMALAIYSVVAAAWVPPRGTDMIQRYAYMADAFARGEWINAFHPKFCLLFPVVTGAVSWLTGLPGDRSCQFVALVGWCLSMIPFWAIFNRLWGRRVAYVAIVLGLLNIDLFFLSMEGWRDSLRMVSIALTVLGFIRSFDTDAELRQPGRGSVLVAIGLSMSATLRVDAMLIAGLTLAVYVAMCGWRRQWHLTVFPVVSFLVATAAQSYMVWSYTGYFLPIPHIIRLVEGVIC